MQEGLFKNYGWGETDMQLSTFLRIANALQISFTPVFG